MFFFNGFLFLEVKREIYPHKKWFLLNQKEYFGNMTKSLKILQQFYNYFRLNLGALLEITLSYSVILFSDFNPLYMNIFL